MTNSEQTDSPAKASLTMKVDGDVGRRLAELGIPQGKSASAMGRIILEEIVPKIDTIQQRAVIRLKGGQQ